MKSLTQTIFLILMSLAVYAQDLTGQWSGVLNVQGTELRVIFHVSKEDNQFKATLDSPDQNVSDIPVTAVSFNYPDIKFEISNLGMVYEGTLSDNQIRGQWMQSGRTFLLVLLKTETSPDKNGQP